MKKTFEEPTLKVIQFTANEAIANGDANLNLSCDVEIWD